MLNYFVNMWRNILVQSAAPCRGPAPSALLPAGTPKLMMSHHCVVSARRRWATHPSQCIPYFLPLQSMVISAYNATPHREADTVHGSDVCCGEQGRHTLSMEVTCAVVSRAAIHSPWK